MRNRDAGQVIELRVYICTYVCTCGDGVLSRPAYKAASSGSFLQSPPPCGDDRPDYFLLAEVHESGI